MAGKLLIVIVAIALLHKVIAEDEAGKRDAFDEADALLAEFAITVEQITTEAETKLQESLEEVTNLGNAVLGVSRRIIMSIQDTLMTELRDLDDLAAKAGVDVVSCTFMAKRQISMIPFPLIVQIEICINNRIDESAGLVQEVFSNLDNARESVEEFRARISDCREANDEVCATIVNGQIEAQNSLLPIILDNDIQEVLGVLSTVESYFQDCTVSPSNTFTLEGNTIVAGARECVENALQLED